MLMTYTGIRPFGEADVPEVADLHRRVMRPDLPPGNGWMQEYRHYFQEVFLSEAAIDSGLSSLVFQRQGRIVGFLGVMPRRMQFQGRPLLAAVCSQFAVDPAERGQVGLQMLKRCLAGPQDVSMTDEAGDCTRKIWEWCGGATALPYSVHWIRPLRPAQAALTADDTRAWWAGLLSPLASAVDLILTRRPGRFRPSPPPGSRVALDAAALLGCVQSHVNRSVFGPAYDARSLNWALARASRHAHRGAVRALAVIDESGARVGWFIYHAPRGECGEVLQVGAEPRHRRTVLDHLLDDAWQQGVTMLSGRLEPALTPELSEHGSLLYRRGHWTLVHSKRPEVAHALQRGDAFFTRLEGEWCLRFR